MQGNSRSLIEVQDSGITFEGAPQRKIMPKVERETGRGNENHGTSPTPTLPESGGDTTNRLRKRIGDSAIPRRGIHLNRLVKENTNLLDNGLLAVGSDFDDAHVRAAAFRGWHSADAGVHAGSAAEKSPPQHSHPGPLATPLIHSVSIDPMWSCVRSDWPVGLCRCRCDGEGRGPKRDRWVDEHDHRAALGSRLEVMAGADTSSGEVDGRDPSWARVPWQCVSRRGDGDRTVRKRARLSRLWLG